MKIATMLRFSLVNPDAEAASGPPVKTKMEFMVDEDSDLELASV